MKTLSFAALLTWALSVIPAQAADKKVDSAVSTRLVEVKVTKKGFEPMSVPVASDKPITLKITRETDQTCATEIIVPKLNIKKELPLNKPVLVELGKVEKGQELKFACGMNMITGVVVAQ